jgi:hypothetical protein
MYVAVGGGSGAVCYRLNPPLLSFHVTSMEVVGQSVAAAKHLYSVSYCVRGRRNGTCNRTQLFIDWRSVGRRLQGREVP